MSTELVTREELNEVRRHIEVTNHEMGIVQQDMAANKEALRTIKDNVKSLDSRIWFIVTGVILVIGMEIARFVNI